MMLFMLFFLMILLIFLGMDIGFSMGIAALTYIFLSQFVGFPIKFTVLPVQMVDGVNAFSLVAVPLFILAGEIMDHGGITTRLVRFASSSSEAFGEGWDIPASWSISSWLECPDQQSPIALPPGLS